MTMGNPHKGEVSFEVDGKRHALVYNMNALCELEDAFGTGITEIAAIMSDPAKMRATTVRKLFWAGLLHESPETTETSAGALIDSLGLMKAVPLVGEAFELAFPQQKKESAGRRRPRRPSQTGTGSAR